MATRMPEVGDRIGRYVLTGLLGRGGMGTVFEARDDSLERVVALKVINPAVAADPDYRERFRREALAMSRLDSPHVVTVHDNGDHDGTPYLVTQLVPGGDLDQLVRHDGALPPGRALALTGQVLDGLADAHRAGIVHRDIKPSNVLLSATGDRAYLCDFGIATSAAAGLTRTGSLMGSIGYMAPERHTGDTSEASEPAGDLYAVGCLLWAMLTGSPPYSGTEYEIASGHLHGPVPQLPGEDAFVRGVNAVLARSLAKDPRQRYPSAGTMRTAVADLLGTAPARIALPDRTSIRQVVLPAAVAPAFPAAPEPAERKRRLPAALLAVVAVLGVVLGVMGIVLAVQRPTLVTALAGDTSPTPAAPSTGPTPVGRPSRSAPPHRPTTRASSSAPVLGSALPPVLGLPGSAGAAAHGTAAATPRAGHAAPVPITTAAPATRPATSAPPPAPAPTSSSAPPPPPPPAYTCWDGTAAASLSSCGYPKGAPGMRWMWPNRTVACSSYSTNTWRCHFAAGENYVFLTQWDNHDNAVARYDRWNADRTVWSHDGERYGLWWRGRDNGAYVSARLYDRLNYWCMVIRATSPAERDVALSKMGAARPPEYIQGKPRS